MLLCLVPFVGACAPPSPPRSVVTEPAVDPAALAIDVAVGRAHSCALRGDGAVFCWGANEIGQLGDGTQRTRSSPVRVLDIDDAVNVRSAGDTTCAVRRSGLVSCWGKTVGETPRPDRGTGFTVRATEVKDVFHLVDVAVAPTHACGWTAEGKVICFGSNEQGALGDSKVEKKGGAADVDLGGPAVSVSVGTHSSCAIAADGRLACWGQANFLILPRQAKTETCFGDQGQRECVRKPVRLPIGFAASAVWIDDRGLCVLGRQGELGCRGDSAREACKGRFCSLSRGSHQLAMFGTSGLSRRVGERAVTDAQGAIYGWGVPGDIACIGGRECKLRRRLIDEPTLGARAVSIGDGHGCAAGPRGVRCWGDNDRGQLGGGDRAVHADATFVKLSEERKGEIAPSPSDQLAARVSDTKLSRFALVWENAELFEAPNEKSSLGKLAVWEDALRLDPFKGRFAARILREDNGFVLVELQGSAADHCAGDVAFKLPLRAYVERSDLVPVVPRPTEIAFENGSSILLGAGLPPLPEDGGFAFDVFGGSAWVGAEGLGLGLSYAKAGHTAPKPKPKTEGPKPGLLPPGFHNGRLPPTVNARLGSRRMRTDPELSWAFSEPVPAGGAIVTIDSRCARVRLFTDLEQPLRLDRSGMGHGGGTGWYHRRSFTARAGSVARWPSGKVAAQLSESLTFYEATSTDKGWCTPIRGTVSVCFDKRDVTVFGQLL